MKTKLFRRVLAVVLCFVLLVSNLPAGLAVEWNGGSSGSNTGDSTAAPGGYSIPNDWDNDGGNSNTVLALRFSYYNVDTGVTKGTTIDVYRSTYWSTHQSRYKFANKRNKMELIDVYRSTDIGDPTTATTNCKKDTTYGISLPSTTDGLGDWQKSNANINAVLGMMGLGAYDVNGDGVFTKDDMGKGDYLLVEPIYPVKIANKDYALTVTEMAIVGSAYHGVDVNGDAVQDSGYDGTWNGCSGYGDAAWLTWLNINNYTNRAWPNSLHLTENWKNSAGNTVLAAAPADHTDSGWYTFDEIINNGLGMGIAWTNS